MKNILFFILGLMLMVGVSATTVSIMTVKPAQPKNTVAFMTYDENPSSKILSYASQGYIVKSIATNGTTSTSRVYVVMERY